MLNFEQLELQYITNEAGEKTAVILSMETFQELLEDLKDLLHAEKMGYKRLDLYGPKTFYTLRQLQFSCKTPKKPRKTLKPLRLCVR